MVLTQAEMESSESFRAYPCFCRRGCGAKGEAENDVGFGPAGMDEERCQEMRAAGGGQIWGARLGLWESEVSLRHVSNEWFSKTVRYDWVGD